MGCSFCYINATPTGAEGNIDKLFGRNLPNHVELAINYNDTHKQFDEYMDCGYFNTSIMNLTINSKLLEQPEQINKLQDWINSEILHGIGVCIHELSHID